MRTSRWYVTMALTIGVIFCAVLAIPPLKNVNISLATAQDVPLAITPVVTLQPQYGAAMAEPPALTLPPAIAGQVGTFIKLTADTKCKEVRWVAMSDGLAVFPGEMLRDSRSTVVTAQVPGIHRVLAYGAAAGIPSEPAYCEITIAGPVVPVPPAPGPGPAPTPTGVPQPSAAAAAAVAPIKAVLANVDATKRAQLAAIWEGWYSVLGGQLPPTTGAYKAAMLAYINAAAAQAGLANAFPGYGAALEQSFTTLLGSADAALPADKAKDFAAALFWAAK